MVVFLYRFIVRACSNKFGGDLDNEVAALTFMPGEVSNYFFARRNGKEKTEFGYRNGGGLKQRSLRV
jgi:hypothetical protein